MALFKCPECGHAVSEFAQTCPNCGCPLKTLQSQEIGEEDHYPKGGADKIDEKELETAKTRMKYEADEKKRANRGLIAIVIILIAIVCAGAALYIINSMNEQADTEKKLEQLQNEKQEQSDDQVKEDNADEQQDSEPAPDSESSPEDSVVTDDGTVIEPPPEEAE